MGVGITTSKKSERKRRKKNQSILRQKKKKNVSFKRTPVLICEKDLIREKKENQPLEKIELRTRKSYSFR
jgi:hypothetical protein